MLWNPLVNALVRPGQVIVSHVLLNEPVDLRAMPDEHMIETFSFQAANNPLAHRIGLRGPDWGP